MNLDVGRREAHYQFGIRPFVPFISSVFAQTSGHSGLHLGGLTHKLPAVSLSARVTLSFISCFTGAGLNDVDGYDVMWGGLSIMGFQERGVRANSMLGLFHRR